MIDIISIVIGMVLMFTLFIIWGVYLAIQKESIKPVVLDGTFDRKPFCKNCGSYDLKLINIKEDLPWLVERGEEIDFYECQKCRSRFNDEDWGDEV